MKVILLREVAGVGKRYDLKTVKDGYGRNFLLQNKLALLATTENIKKIEQERRAQATEQEISVKLFKETLADLKKYTLVIKAKANEQGHLFVGIHQADMAAALKVARGVSFEPDWFKLEKPLKALGEYPVPIAHGELTGNLQIRIEAEE